MRDVIDKLKSLIGNGQQGPAAVSTQLREPTDNDRRHAKIHRVCHPDIDAIGLSWILIMVHGQN